MLTDEAMSNVEVVDVNSGEAQVEVAMGVLCALRVGRGFVSSERVELLRQTGSDGARMMCLVDI